MASITVIDDSPGARLFVSACFKGTSHSVQELEPTCLYKVLQALHDAMPDLLVSDLLMPTCPGQTLIRACREDVHLKDLRILLLTAHGDVQLAHFLQTMGNTHYLTKPVAPTALRECVDQFLVGGLQVDPGWALACKGVVAVVDDSHLSRAYHAACLRKRGFRPVEIEPTEVLDTVHALEAASPQLLLLDFLMPHFHGDALIRALRGSARLAGMPVLLITAHHDESVQAMVDPAGRVEVLYKPVQPDALMERVEALLGG